MTILYHYGDQDDTMIPLLKCICTAADILDCFILEHVFQQAYPIVEKCCFHHSSYEYTKYATKFVRIFCSKLSTGRMAGEHDYSDGSMDKLSHWIEKSLVLIQSKYLYFQQVEDILILIEFYRIFNFISEVYSDLCENFYSLFLSNTRTLLTHLLQQQMNYHWSSLNGYTSDGDKYDVNVLVCQLLNIMNNMNWSKINVANDEMNSLIQLLLEYVQLSPQQLELFEQSPNEFVTFEEYDLFDISARHIIPNIIQSLCKFFRLKFISNYVSILESIHDKNYVLYEAYMWGCMFVCKIMIKWLKKGRKYLVDDSESQSYRNILRYMINLVRPILLHSSEPILQGRAALCLSIMSEYYENIEEVEIILDTYMTLLLSSHSTVKLQTCKALSVFLMNIKSLNVELKLLSLKSSQFVQILLSVFPLFDETTLHIHLETMSLLIQQSNTIDTKSCTMVIDLVFHVWKTHTSDIFVVEVARDLLRVALKYTAFTFSILIECHFSHFNRYLLQYDATAVSLSLALLLSDISNHSLLHSYPNGVQILIKIISCLLTTCSMVQHCKEECLESVLVTFSSPDNAILLQQYQSHANITELLHHLNSYVARNLDNLKTLSSNFLNVNIGLFCHLIFDHSAVFSDRNLLSMVQKYITVIQSCETIGVKKSLLFGLIYLVARCSGIILPILSQMLTIIADFNALEFIYQQWSELHMTLVHSKYNLSISSIGLVELMKAFNVHEVNHGLASHTCSLILSTISRLTDDTVLLFDFIFLKCLH